MTTKRRTFIASCLAAPAAVALPATAATPARERWPDFIAQSACLHPNGAATAQRAQRAGLDLDALTVIQLGGGQSPADYPIMFFRSAEGGHVIVSPRDVWKA